jgi:hypothetical protein
MNKVSGWIAISALSLAIIPFVSGCGESESSKQVKESSMITSYVQPAPAPMVQQAPSTINTTEEKSASHTTEMGHNSTAENTNAYHSESTTVTPSPMAAPAPMPPAMQSQTTVKKTYKETTD